MARRATSEQYATLLRIKYAWPEKLYLGPYYRDSPEGPKKCAVGHIAHEVYGHRHMPYLVNEFHVSDITGIPFRTLTWLGLTNDFNPFYLFAPRRRAKGMLRRFNKFLNRLKIMAPPMQQTSAELQDELYETALSR